MNKYIATREAERKTGVDHTTISRCCKNKQKTAEKLIRCGKNQKIG